MPQAPLTNGALSSLVLNNKGSIAQVVQGPVTHTGTLTATGPLWINSDSYYFWHGSGADTQGVGLQGAIYLGGSPTGNGDGTLQTLLLSDSLANTGYTTNGWLFLHQYNDGAEGARGTFNVQLQINATSTIDSENQHTCFQPFIEGNATIPEDVDVALFCMNGAVGVNAAGYSSAIWLEADMYAAYPIVNFIGFNLELQGGHAYQGSSIDAGLLFTADGAAQPLKNIISVGSVPSGGKGSPIGANTTVLKVWTNSTSGVQQPGTVENGLDFSAGYLTITGNLLVANGTTITGAGVATFAGLDIPVVTTAPTGTPNVGSIVFNKTSGKLNVFNGTTWYSSAAFTAGAG